MKEKTPGSPRAEAAKSPALARGVVSWAGRPIEAVLFDLDGTLLDTVADITCALSRAFDEQGWPALGPDTVRTLVGRGAAVLIERAAGVLGRAPDEPQRQALLTRFLHHYAALEQAGEIEARPYEGARAALEGVRALGLATAVVTNKDQRISEGLLRQLDLASRIDVVIGAAPGVRRKPHPEPLLIACSRLGTLPARTLMVGDSVNDVEAARAAGMPVICVTYGYNEGADPRSLPADAWIDSLVELLPLLRAPP